MWDSRGASLHVAVGWLVVAAAVLGVSSVAWAQSPAKGQILCETYREGNWELFRMDADGSDPVNLTQTPGLDELYPHASPDGKRICFVVDSGEGAQKMRSVYYMNADGSGRTLVADKSRQPCWSPDSTKIAFVKQEFPKLNIADYVSKGLYFYDLKSGETTEHQTRRSATSTILRGRPTAAGSSPPSTRAWGSATESSPSRSAAWAYITLRCRAAVHA